jgi:hypothetical protein
VGDHGGKTWRECRFAPGNTDTSQPPLERGEARQDLLKGERLEGFGGKDERVIMAEGAAEIASAQEEDGTKPPRPVHERGLKNPSDDRQGMCEA